jgi:hypothetical protein
MFLHCALLALAQDPPPGEPKEVLRDVVTRFFSPGNRVRSNLIRYASLLIKRDGYKQL